GSTGDRALVTKTIQQHGITAIIHFAASIVVPESVADPLGYYSNNTMNTCSLLDVAIKTGVQQFIFSSTAAVYGNAEQVPVREDAPAVPISPYGTSKLMSEIMLHDAGKAHGLRFVVLRYFNVAGADPKLRTGQSTPAATHLIKVACEAALGKRAKIEVYGTDYPTPDGTCVRDYIHVVDLAQAHILAMKAIDQKSRVYNLGNGQGFSVKQVIDTACKITGHAIPTKAGARRPGDPAVLIAGSQKIRQELNWQPRFPGLDEIVQSAWDWHKSHPQGYSDSND
ncbi:MAG: UDP-glucose 4-epimerase GalE, partial [Terriglobia bacterium]